MTERERWIVYPLLFFALGAALRDKVAHQVRTDRLHAAEMSCEKLVILDSEKPDRPVAMLSSMPAQAGAPGGDRFGQLVLYDSQSNEFCGVTNNSLVVKQIASEQLTVVDPQNRQRPLAILTAATATGPDKKTKRIGSLFLTDSEGQQLFGLVNDQLRMRRIECEGIAVVDPENPKKILAGLGSTGEKGQRFGVLALNNQKFGTLTGNPPPSARPAQNPGDDAAPEDAGDEPPSESDADPPVPSDER